MMRFHQKVLPAVAIGHSPCAGENGKIRKKRACRRDVSVSAAHQGESSPARRKVARQTRIDPKRKKERNATGLNRVAKKSLYFDPQALLATIGEGMKSVLLKRKQRIFAQGDTADAMFYMPMLGVPFQVWLVHDV